jgi:phenylpropionate dioxygenase-like ring-hydroxylating dioxygenase large terminal subunit
MSTLACSDLVKTDRVKTAVYRNPALFELEMERIFKGTWVWVGHESELPAAHTFKTAHIGLQPVIVSRDRAGQIHVLLNRCRHRAASICEAKRGKATVFVCPYHAWSYEIDGRLRKVPRLKGYADGLDTASLGLVRLRSSTYAGLIFATFAEDIVPLEDFLGPAKEWIDLFMKQGAGFGIRTAGEHKFRFPGNWKIQLENTTDAYHFPVVHKTFLTSLDGSTEGLFDVLNQGGWVEDLGNGHSVMVMIPDLVDLDRNLDAPIPERFRELASVLSRSHSPEDVARIVRAVGGTGFNLNLFPNLACSMSFFRVLRPIAVDETEITHVALAMDGGPEPANRMRLRLHEHFQGPMGFGSPDDAEGWERVQRGAAAGDDLWIMVNREAPAEGSAGAPAQASDVSAETGMRAAYAMWQRMMAR